MAYEIEDIRLSQEIFYYLLEHHELREDNELRLYKAYTQEETIQNLVKSQGEISDCHIERYGNVIYLIPKENNSFLGFSKAQMKAALCRSNATDKDYYLSQFVILTLLVEFFDGQGSSAKSREYMRVGELQNCISKRLKEGAKSRGEEEEEKQGIAFSNMLEAYEALMRVKMQLLNSPLTVMKLAREMDKLYEVERLTIFKATSTFVMMQNRGRLHRNTKLFLNSIASSSLTDEDVAEFKAQFAELLNNLVIEITEEEEIDREALERKRRALGNQGALALDDWGSGYSNSNSLLELSPDYIKVDITIICDIDTDADKQQLVKDIVEYAHGRGMKIVAEGIETEAELRKVIELGVDLLQGYFLAKPAASPSEIAPQALSVIRWMSR